MSALLDSIRSVERAMAARSIIPLALVVVALLVHLGLEVDRSRAAGVGRTLESDVAPAMADVVARIGAEVASRFTATTVAGVAGTSTAVQSTETLATVDANLVAATDAAVNNFAAVFASLHADSATLADSPSNLAPCAAPSCGADAIRSQLSTFRGTTDAVAAVRALTELSIVVPRTMTAAFLDASAMQPSGRLLTRLGASYVEAVANAYLELTTLHALFHRSQSLNAATAVESDNTRAVESFLVARSSLRYLLSFADIDAFGRSDPLLYADIIASARSALSDADALIPRGGTTTASPLRGDSTFQVTLNNLRGLNGLLGSAMAVATEPPTNVNRKERDGLWVAVGVTAGVVVCLGLTVAVAAGHIRTSSEETRLMAQFSDAAHTREVGQAFQPVLVGLRVDLIAQATASSRNAKASAEEKKNNKSSPAAASTAVDKKSNGGGASSETSTELIAIYTAASRVVCEVRPFLPQTLFGTLVDDGHAVDGAARNNTGGQQDVQQRGKDGSAATASAAANPTLAAAEAAANNTFLGGALSKKTAAPVSWRPWEHSVRLDSTVCSTRCTLLSVVPLQPNRDVMADPAGALVWFNSVLATTTALVNEAGGSIHSVENNGIIVCMWNVTQRAGNAATVALRVARALVTCFEDIDLNIVTGQCMVANAKTGRRRNVVVVGAALEFSERVLMLNRLHTSSIVLDFDSYRDLALDEQAQCRPIALLHTTPTSRVVLYSADAQRSRTITPNQRKAYLAAFALYQNGMYEDSLQLFSQYLRQYGDDGPAEWIVSHLLSHKLKPIQTIADTARVNFADRGDAIEHFHELRVWGGG
eukprot:CAMPEP_0174841938 /NCGR_PEP_ID=MMETSP1114-20130205/9621_1 /TAXON_ID=312471 /ORGANISM="Neobodo designis, Strain CCAP 1951/1" /LENGTH=821 /DNA_ID=CAMNT_0016076135 /DNA_START=37 /DNA_END=2502 /DNA_ORIENTATION=+